MTRYDALAVVQAAENLAAYLRHRLPKAKRWGLQRAVQAVRRAGKRSAALIEKANRDLAAYKALVPRLERERDRMERKVGRLRLRVLRTGER